MLFPAVYVNMVWYQVVLVCVYVCVWSGKDFHGPILKDGIVGYFPRVKNDVLIPNEVDFTGSCSAKKKNY